MHIRTPNQTRITPSQEFCTLPFGEQLLLWAVRYWAQATRNQTCPHALLAEAFSKVRAGAAHPPLDTLLTVINVSATRAIDVRCPACREVSSDEHTLLGLIADFQAGDTEGRAESFLAAWLPPTARRVAGVPAAEVARALGPTLYKIVRFRIINRV